MDRIDTIPNQSAESNRAIAVVGRIVSINGTPPNWDAEATTYNIRATVPGIGTTLLREQVPQQRLWRLTGVSINAETLIGRSVHGVWIGGVFRWNFYEPPMVGGCTATPPPPPGGNTIPVPIGSPAPPDGGSRGGAGPGVGDGPSDAPGGPVDGAGGVQ